MPGFRDILDGVNFFVGTLGGVAHAVEQNRKHEEDRALKLLQLAAQEPGLQLQTVPLPQGGDLGQRVLGTPQYQNVGGQSYPVVPFGGAGLTVNQRKTFGDLPFEVVGDLFPGAFDLTTKQVKPQYADVLKQIPVTPQTAQFLVTQRETTRRAESAEKLRLRTQQETQAQQLALKTLERLDKLPNTPEIQGYREELEQLSVYSTDPRLALAKIREISLKLPSPVREVQLPNGERVPLSGKDVLDLRQGQDKDAREIRESRLKRKRDILTRVGDLIRDETDPAAKEQLRQMAGDFGNINIASADADRLLDDADVFVTQGGSGRSTRQPPGDKTFEKDKATLLEQLSRGRLTLAKDPEKLAELERAYDLAAAAQSREALNTARTLGGRYVDLKALASAAQGDAGKKQTDIDRAQTELGKMQIELAKRAEQTNDPAEKATLRDGIGKLLQINADDKDAIKKGQEVVAGMPGGPSDIVTTQTRIAQGERSLGIRQQQADIAKAREAQLTEIRNLNKRELELKLTEATDPVSKGIELRKIVKQEPAYQDYQGTQAGYIAVRRGYRDAMAGGTEKAVAQGDFAIINGIVRLLDPGVSVRPSEFDSVKRAQSLVDQLQVYLASTLSGRMLSDDVRKNYLKLAEGLFKDWRTATESAVNDIYGPSLKKYNIPQTQILESVPTEFSEDLLKIKPAFTPAPGARQRSGTRSQELAPTQAPEQAPTPTPTPTPTPEEDTAAKTAPTPAPRKLSPRVQQYLFPQGQ